MKRINFFRELNTQTINEIKDDLLKHSKGSTATYNEIIDDYRAFIGSIIGIDEHISTSCREQEFDSTSEDLKPLDRGDIRHFEEFGIYDRNLLFDFITIEPNTIKVVQLKISCRFEAETERINAYAFGAFRFKEACKLVIAELLEQKPAVTETEPLDLSDSSGVEKIIYLNELGIIDFLRTKTKVGISNGGLASVLSGITGMNPNTIKSSLNRLPKDNKIDNKHPYYTTKTVDKIKTFLIKLGF